MTVDTTDKVRRTSTSIRLGLGVLVAVVSTVAVAAAFGASGGAGSTPSATERVAAGQCSKAAAVRVVKRLRLGAAGLIPNPVHAVLCGAFMGPGSRVMVVSLASDGASVPFGGWVVFRLAGGTWQLVMQRRDGAEVSAAGSDIRESLSILRPGDSHCCPTGGTRARLWHWNGTRFVAGPWKRATKGDPRPRAFDSPSLNISCGMFDDSGGRYVRCQSHIPPQTARLDADGRVTMCMDLTPKGGANECNLGDRGENPTRPLAYGKQITVGRFRCLSLEIGVKCTVIKSGKGFLISRDGVERVP